ncbi:J domain-containing protein [Oceanobacter kriegii]|uniref:J domain-containing protein n=1 Tax=Oceanobacter kriegii TaxID=64972 RepID=UPI00146E3276|nr:J domain-containing protein [Oceanobacter kriegii]
MTASNLKHCYHTLGLEDGANAEQVRQAYRRLVRAFHPDHNPQMSTDGFSKIQDAYTRLMAAAGAQPETATSVVEPPQAALPNRRNRRRGTPGNRRFETIMEDQYKGVNIRTDA